MEVNPISGRTLHAEIAIARYIGGRLPYHTWQSLIRRGIPPPPSKPIDTRGAKSKRKYRQT